MSDLLSNRLPVFWCQAPDEEEDVGFHSLTFRITDDWFAVDSDQLILPVTVVARDGDDVEPVTGLLKQYGGEAMLNDLLVEALNGDETPRTWCIQHGDRRQIYPVDRSD